MYLNIEKISEEDLIKNDKNTNFYSVRLINGMFFLLLIISSGFVGDILNCKYQRTIVNNIYMKHLVAFLTLYFLNSNLFTDEDHPINKLLNCIILYIIFVIIMRLNLTFTGIVLILIFIIHLLHQHYTFYRENPDKIENYKLVIRLHYFIRIISIVTLIIAIIGLIINIKQRKKEYGKDFNLNKFILGNLKCENIEKKIIYN
jgi:hypothetical protein